MADAMSRYAYPASKAFQDVSFHGSAEAQAEMKAIIEQELSEGRMVIFICFVKHTRPARNVCLVGGGMARRAEIPASRVWPISKYIPTGKPRGSPRKEPVTRC